MKIKQTPRPATTAALVLWAGISTGSPAGAQNVAPWSTGPFSCYEVPAMSSEQRLPTALPKDGRLSTRLSLVAAQGEFEPASFVIAPRAAVARLELRPTALSGPAGEIPVANVDIKVVKAWYQGGTAWYSYFADSNRRELTPELLLNDETLVRVNHKTKDNYLRVGTEYQWISYPADKAEKPFNYLTEPVADSKTLQPVQLTPGENKQIWVTIKAPAEAAAGLYSGRINLTADGRPAGFMDVQLRVLPFSLPLPRTYYDLDNPYLVTIYGTNNMSTARFMGVDREVADRQQLAIYKNLLDHNVFNVRSDQMLANQKDRATAIRELQHELQLMKQAGVVMKPLLSRGWVFYGSGEDKDKELTLYKARIDDLARTLKEAVGHDEIYVTSWDEAGADRVRIMRELAPYANSRGLKLWVTTAHDRHFNLAGYMIDYANHGGWPEKEFAEPWHAVGGKVASYAGPHTGPENPNVFRLYEGLARYKANYDGSFNYKYFSAFNTSVYTRLKSNLWNDFNGGTFRQFNMVYPTPNGMIDTLAWEGFREGIDDVRYATKLKQEAAAAIAGDSVEARHTAKKALMWLHLLDAHSADLNATRLEMIEHIQKIQRAREASR